MGIGTVLGLTDYRLPFVESGLQHSTYLNFGSQYMRLSPAVDETLITFYVRSSEVQIQETIVPYNLSDLIETLGGMYTALAFIFAFALLTILVLVYVLKVLIRR